MIFKYYLTEIFKKMPSTSFVSTIRMTLSEAVILTRFFSSLNINIRNRSELFRLVIGEFCQLVLTKHPEFEPLNEEEAFLVLKNSFFSLETQSKKTVFKFLQNASLTQTQAELVRGEKTVLEKETEKENETETETEVKKASEILRNILKQKV